MTWDSGFYLNLALILSFITVLILIAELLVMVPYILLLIIICLIIGLGTKEEEIYPKKVDDS